MASLDASEWFSTQKNTGKRKVRGISKVRKDHNYAGSYTYMGQDCVITDCKADYHLDLPKCVKRTERRKWTIGFLLENLRFCAMCRLGPVNLTYDSVVGEMRKGLSGYLYVRCQNPDCLHVNRVPYGKTHRIKRKGMPCFAANTKLGVGKSIFMCLFSVN